MLTVSGTKYQLEWVTDNCFKPTIMANLISSWMPHVFGTFYYISIFKLYDIYTHCEDTLELQRKRKKTKLRKEHKSQFLVDDDTDLGSKHCNMAQFFGTPCIRIVKWISNVNVLSCTVYCIHLTITINVLSWSIV